MVHNRIFAFARPDESGALKLPEARIEELVADGEIRHLVMGSRTMREWVVIPDIAAPGNHGLLLEAKAYVASLPEEKKRRTAKKSSKKMAAKNAAVKTAKKKTAKKVTKTR
jgi:hypothetical protein